MYLQYAWISSVCIAPVFVPKIQLAVQIRNLCVHEFQLFVNVLAQYKYDNQNGLAGHDTLSAFRDATFQEISWNQEISDRNKELQEKWNSVSR